MHRRLVALLLAALVLIPAVPAAAAEPGTDETPSPVVEPTPPPETEPTPAPDAEPSPAVEPDPSADPDPAPSDDAAPTDPADPATDPVADPVTDPADPAIDPALEPGPPAADPDPALPSLEETGGLDPTGQFIVILKSGANTQAVVDRIEDKDDVDVDRTFTKAVRGFTAELDAEQQQAVADDPSVVAVVPDELIKLTAQTIPTGVSRIGARLNGIAEINGSDQRVDADVAIVDTGVGPPSGPQRGGWLQLLELEPLGLGRRRRPRHACGGDGRRDGQRHRGRRRRARAPHLVGQDPQLGRLRLPVVVRLRPRLDPRPARPERLQPPAHRGREHERHEVGLGRRRLRLQEQRHPARRHLPARGGWHHGRRGGRQRRGECHQARPRLLQRGHHGLRARRHRRQGRRPRRQPLLFVGRLRQGRHVRRLQQLRLGRRPHRAGQVHLVDEARATLRLLVGDVDGRPGRDRRRRAVKASRPYATPAEVKEGAPVPRQPGLEDLDRPRHPPREAPGRLEARAARDLRSSAARRPRPFSGETGGVRSCADHRLAGARPCSSASGSSSARSPSGWTATLDNTSLFGWTAKHDQPAPHAAEAHAVGHVSHHRRPATNQNRSEATTVNIVVENDLPIAKAAVGRDRGDGAGRLDDGPGQTQLAVGHRCHRAPSPATSSSCATNGGAWGSTTSTEPSVRSTRRRPWRSTPRYDVRVRARDSAGNWSDWVRRPDRSTSTVVQDRATVDRLQRRRG